MLYRGAKLLQKMFLLACHFALWPNFWLPAFVWPLFMLDVLSFVLSAGSESCWPFLRRIYIMQVWNWPAADRRSQSNATFASLMWKCKASTFSHRGSPLYYWLFVARATKLGGQNHTGAIWIDKRTIFQGMLGADQQISPRCKTGCAPSRRCGSCWWLHKNTKGTHL